MLNRASSSVAAIPQPLSAIDALSVRLGPLILATRRATRTPTTAAIGAAADAVAELISTQPCRIPDSWLSPGPLSYRRFELWRDPELDCQILAMVWPVGARTPIHDHGGAFGIEAVWAGELSVTDFRVLESTRNAVRLGVSDTRRFSSGQLLTMQAPADLHLCRNPSQHGATVSLHVYGRSQQRQTVYQQLEDDWYALQLKDLPTEVV